MAKLNEDEREELVAYLDGELDEATARQVEAKLTLHPELRAEAESMRQAWDMLDYLPKPEPSNNFTNRTMERLALRESVDTVNMRKPGRGRPWAYVAWVAAIVVAWFLGWLVTPHLFPRLPTTAEDPDIADVLLQHSRVLENKALYDNIEDLEFLRMLDQPELFGEDPSGSS